MAIGLNDLKKKKAKTEVSNLANASSIPLETSAASTHAPNKKALPWENFDKYKGTPRTINSKRALQEANLKTDPLQAKHHGRSNDFEQGNESGIDKTHTSTKIELAPDLLPKDRIPGIIHLLFFFLRS